jgi:hypothetical protein
MMDIKRLACLSKLRQRAHYVPYFHLFFFVIAPSSLRHVYAVKW